MSDIVERLKNYIPGEHEQFVPEVNALAIAEIERLRKGIQDYLDGNYENPRQHRPVTCKHGHLWYQGCEQCDTDHFTSLLASDQCGGGS